MRRLGGYSYNASDYFLTSALIIYSLEFKERRHILPESPAFCKLLLPESSIPYIVFFDSPAYGRMAGDHWTAIKQHRPHRTNHQTEEQSSTISTQLNGS